MFSAKGYKNSSRELATHETFQVGRVFQRALVVDECLHVRHSKEPEGTSVETQSRVDDVSDLHRSYDEANEARS